MQDGGGACGWRRGVCAMHFIAGGAIYAGSDFGVGKHNSLAGCRKHSREPAARSCGGNKFWLVRRPLVGAHGMAACVAQHILLLAVQWGGIEVQHVLHSEGGRRRCSILGMTLVWGRQGKVLRVHGAASRGEGNILLRTAERGGLGGQLAVHAEGDLAL